MCKKIAFAAVLLVLCAAPAAVAQDKELTAEQKDRIERAKGGVQIAGMSAVVFVVVSLVVFVVSMSPTAIAFARGHPNAVPILLVNLVTWWTCLGFFVCLVWSLTATRVRTVSDEPRRRRRRDDYED